MAYLVLLRHGKSTWNQQGLWTGRRDVPLSEGGRQESYKAAQKLKDMSFDFIFTSTLRRAKETLAEMHKVINIKENSVIEAEALNERDYGELTGKNKWEIKNMYGNELFRRIRRSFDYPIPQGETLRDVYNRIVPYYEEVVLPKLREGRNILMVLHGNSMRALVKFLEDIGNTSIQNLEIETGEIYLYQVDELGGIVSKEIR